ncbi:polynucleotide adenylyltransferase PcnB [Cellvibrio polysaccharolyticus]|uniref:Poly(A) polymerase I n=1 Tax=Cellvibrio polysaccharolyticus TaxID=2082724 RepID=A0A928YSV4_9GAMM|nr:polynucleotide adenylyltransferase PcnB [Cellvibrio polysaccharolyticus]MBE8716369.1 polynucleotide adenylyltransferase PcnB [Cellvibrio polysaccharolyticus]
MLKRLLNFISPKSNSSTQGKLRVISRDDHNISRKNISPAVIKVIKQLVDAGYEAYLVGGGVRDLLLEGKPKDFDVATSATPEQIRRLFRGARIIGRRFQIVHVRMGREVFEVTTFRGASDDNPESKRSQDGMLLRDNVYGTLASDAMRRDFTVNALYYSPNDFAVYDYTGGMEDLKSRTLRIIGDPVTRYKEDPVRMLRALRFAGKLGFAIEPATAQPVRELGHLLENISESRLFEEILKLFLGGSALATFTLLREYGLLANLFPGTHAALADGDEFSLRLIEQTMSNTDKRIRAEKTVTPAFLYAALLWPALQREKARLLQAMPESAAYAQAAQQVVTQQLQRTSIPKRFSIPMREIWDLQMRLTQRAGLRAVRLLDHPRFRAAYDFLLMREDAGEQLDGLGSWWTRFQSATEDEQEEMIKTLNRREPGNKPRRRRRSPTRKKPMAPQE